MGWKPLLQSFVRVAASRPRFTVAVCAALALWGAVAYAVLLPREGFPTVLSPEVVVNGRYLADDPERLDAMVSNQLGSGAIVFADAIATSSVSRDTSFTVRAEFAEGTASDEAVDAMWGAVFASGLPPDVLLDVQPVNEAKILDRFDALVAVHVDPDVATTDQVTPAALQEAAERLRDTFDGHPDLAEAEVLPLVAGATDPATGRWRLWVSDFALYAAEGADGPRFRSAVAVGVEAAPGVDSLEVRATLEDLLAAATEGPARPLPEPYEADIALDFAPQIRSQLSSLASNVVAGMAAVTLVVLVLISWRASLVSAVFLVTVLAVSFGVLDLLGITLNTVSLFGLIVAVGLLVDDAIVVTEAVVAERAAGAGGLDAVTGAVARVGPASISGSLTTMLVFAPMLAITGVLGDFIRILPLAVITALAVSLVLSFALIPVLGRWWVLPAPAPDGPAARLERRLADGLARAVAAPGRLAPVRGAALVAVSVVATGVGLFVFAPRVGFNIFPPQSDSTELAIEVDFPPGTDIDQARETAAAVAQGAVEALGADVVGGFTFLGTDREAATQLSLSPIGNRAAAPVLAEEVVQPRAQAEADEILPGTRVSTSHVSAGPPELTFPFQAQVYFHDLEVLTPAAVAIRDALTGTEIARPDGTTFRVVETELAFTDDVARRDGQRYLEVRARFDADDVSTTTAATQAFVEERFDADRLAALGLPPRAVQFDFGEESDNQEAFASVPLAFALALVSMLVVLVVQFRSTSQWLLVFLAIPFGFFGVFGGLLLTGHVLSFFVMLGLIGLIGIAVNNTILLVDAANRERRAGRDRHTAMVNAVRRRFRPLVATSLTTVAGLLPLALTDPFWEALGLTIVFGVVSSTLLVLVSFPSYYLAVEAVRERIRPPWRRAPDGGPAAEADVLGAAQPEPSSTAAS